MHSTAQASGMAICVTAATSFGGGKAQGRAHPFAAGKERVAHGLVDGGGLGFLGRQEFVERGVDGVGARGEKLVQIECFWCGHKIKCEKMPEKGAGLKDFFVIAFARPTVKLRGSI